ncbi:LysR substrate-binding domain-containing protein [Oceanimonas pelagia]|uniref:LysR substrate-binding domain-containing protein n=1 Tax=Oceanimonas pelagia TaxID=3028314 RepID=A0AA50KKX6_9GAMM|nr:LysR substrate-binding domain-containing protein [Oceanimonas pelagia]WMC09690.1 LysR substrate-binding domain-containing protein [Oceanimonas pelagia]
MSLPPLYALRAFEAAARFGSFSKAAASLHVTPGAVSRHIRTLEDWFGCELFVRKGPRVDITSAGKVLAGQLGEGFQLLETACHGFRRQQHELRLKAPSTLTMRWLLNVLSEFQQRHHTPKVQISSVWMDVDEVDFSREAFDCAILLGNGQFGPGTQSQPLFDEWLIPVCAPALVQQARQNLAECELIHPSPDRRDWQRWLAATGRSEQVELLSGKVFDTLEQGSLAAISGHGVSVGDLLLSLDAVNSALLALPFNTAVATGDGYYLVWPANTRCRQQIDVFYEFIAGRRPSDLPEYIEQVRLN